MSSLSDFAANVVRPAVSEDTEVRIVKRHEFADVLDNMTRDELQTMCENLLDNEKQMRKELDEIRGIIR